MNYKVIYRGAFGGRTAIWTVEILQLTDADVSVGELRFPADEPLIIERDEVGKEVPLQGSTATLKVLSPGDRTYINLYSITPGQISLRVYRQGVVWWIGCLDPEFYEEPYSSYNEYEVSLTFSDFGILKRLKMTTGGTLREMLTAMMSAAGLGALPIDTSMVTTTLADGTTGVVDGLSVVRKNWTDEDGEDCSMENAATGFLQPLALKLSQRGGKIWLYDLNGLYLHGLTKEVVWMSDDQVLGVDKVQNKISVTFSPYCDATLTDAMAYTNTPQKNALRALDGFPYWTTTPMIEIPGYASGDPLYFTYWNSDNANQSSTLKSYHSFTMYLGRKAVGIGIKSLLDTCWLYKLEPIYDGEESIGIACACPLIGAVKGTGGRTDANKWYAEQYNHRVAGQLYAPWVIMPSINLFVWQDIAIQPLYDTDASMLRLRINMDMLLATRYNPFVDPGDDYDNGMSNNTADKDVVMAALLCVIEALDKDGKVLQIYNSPFLRHEKDIASSCKGWTNYSDLTSGSTTYLTWYDGNDKDSSVIGTWKSNRQPSGCWYEDKNAAMAKLDDGMYIDYPTSTIGKEVVAIRISVKQGLYLFGKGFSQLSDDLNKLWSPPQRDSTYCVQWMLLKGFGVTIVSAKDKMEELTSDDVTYYGYAHKDAQEDLGLNTTCGTLEQVMITSKGTYRKSSDGSFVTKLMRAGRTETAEQLLIGTLQSQFCDRRTKLSGTEEETGGGLRLRTEVLQGDKRFAVTAESIDAGQDLTTTTMVEVRPDEHEGESELED